MIIAFAGHSVVPSTEKVRQTVEEKIRSSMIGGQAVTCYLGGYGSFDEICARACKELKKEFTGIETVYVTPYIGPSAEARIAEMQNCGLYDAVVYPPIENVPLRFAISKRNEWMMANADLIIAYVSHSYGGAYKSLQAAKRKKKKIINIADFVDRESE